MSNLGNREVFSRNLRYYMALNGKTRNDMCDALGFPYTTFTNWEIGETYPRIDKIEMLANFFGILKSDLIEDKGGRNEKPADNGGPEEGVSLFRALPPEARQEALEYMKYLRDRKAPQK